MRLAFWRDRPEPAAADSAPDAAPAPVPAPGPAPVATDIRRAPTGRAHGWRDLAPIQRAVTPLTLTGPHTRMEAALSSWRDPSMVAPLGHVIDPAAPGGLVTAVPAPADSPPSAPAGSEPAASAPLDLPVLGTGPVAAGSPPTPSRGVRVQRVAALTPLTEARQVATPPRPVPAVARATSPAPARSTLAGPAAPPSVGPTLGAEVAPELPVAPSAASVSGSPVAAEPAAPRRLGLGAPVQQVPVERVAERPPLPGDTGTDRAPVLNIQRTTRPAGSATTPLGPPSGSVAGATAPADAGVLPVLGDRAAADLTALPVQRSAADPRVPAGSGLDLPTASPGAELPLGAAGTIGRATGEPDPTGAGLGVRASTGSGASPTGPAAADVPGPAGPAPTDPAPIGPAHRGTAGTGLPLARVVSRSVDPARPVVEPARRPVAALLGGRPAAPSLTGTPVAAAAPPVVQRVSRSAPPPQRTPGRVPAPGASPAFSAPAFAGPDFTGPGFPGSATTGPGFTGQNFTGPDFTGPDFTGPVTVQRAATAQPAATFDGRPDAAAFVATAAAMGMPGAAGTLPVPGMTVPVPPIPVSRATTPSALRGLSPEIRGAMMSAALAGGAAPTVMRVPADSIPEAAWRAAPAGPPSTSPPLASPRPAAPRPAGGLPVVVERSAPIHTGPTDIPLQRVATEPAYGGSGGDAGAVPVQRDEAITSTAAPSTAPEPATAGEHLPAPEELAARLFDPLLRRLRNELRLERDRHGTVTDLRGF